MITTVQMEIRELGIPATVKSLVILDVMTHNVDLITISLSVMMDLATTKTIHGPCDLQISDGLVQRHKQML